MAKFISAKAVVSARTYTIAESAAAVGVTPQTIHIWIGVGLPCMTGSRPYLITGRDLKRWIEARRKMRTRLAHMDSCACAAKCLARPIPVWPIVVRTPEVSGTIKEPSRRQRTGARHMAAPQATLAQTYPGIARAIADVIVRPTPATQPIRRDVR